MVRFVEINHAGHTAVWAYMDGKLEDTLRNYYGPNYSSIERRDIEEREAKITVVWRDFMNSLAKGNSTVNRTAFCLGDYR